MDGGLGDGQYAPTSIIAHKVPLQSRLPQPIQVGGLVEQVAKNDKEHRPERSFLISFSPQTSLSSENSDLTPFTSTASEVDVEESSREDSHFLGGITGFDQGLSQFGSSSSAFGTQPKIEHASKNFNLLDLNSAMAASRSSSGRISVRQLQEKGNENLEEPYSTSVATLQLRNGQQTSWNGPDTGVANAGYPYSREVRVGQHSGVDKSFLVEGSDIDTTEDGARQWSELAVQASAPPGEESASRRSALAGLENEDPVWGVEQRTRRPSSELSRTPPRALAGGPSDPGGMQPARSHSLSKHRRGSSQSEDGVGMFKVKFLCSAGGEIKFTDGKLRYVGGETRIFTVSRDITYSELMFKLTEYYSEALSLKYQLPDMDLDTLLSVSNDEDLNSMMEEYDEIERNSAEGKAQRLRLFLFPAEGKEGLRAPYEDAGPNFEKYFGMEDAVPQSVLRTTYHFDDVEQRPGTGPQYGHQGGGHYGPPGTDVLVLDSLAHHPHLHPPPQDLMAPPKLPPLHLQQSMQHPSMAPFSHASSPRRSPTDTPTMGPELGAGAYSAGPPRLDLGGLSAEHLQQQQQHKLHQLQAFDELWHAHQHADGRPPEHARPDLPPLHPSRTSPPASTQEAGMLRVRSRDNLARLGDMAALEGHPRSTNSSPRHDDQAAAAFAAAGHGDPYTPHPLPPRPPSGGQQGRLGQHMQSESALDLQEGQFGSRLPQPPSMPQLHAGLAGVPLKLNLHSEPASPGYAHGQYKRAGGLGEFGESASPHETPRYGRRHTAVDGSSPPMADSHVQHPPSHVEAFRRQHSQHPRSLPGSPRQMEFREPIGEAWHHDQMISRFAQHGASDASLRGFPADQAGVVGSPGGHLYRGRVGDGSGRWAGDAGLWRAEQAADVEVAQQGYLEMDTRERPYEAAHGGPAGGGDQRVHRWLDGQSGERDAHYGDSGGRMPRSASQRQLQEGEPYWQAKTERELRQDSGARDGLPGLAGSWDEGRRDVYPEDHGEGASEPWQDGRRVPLSWGQDVGRGGMPRRGSNQDLHRTAGDSGQAGPDAPFFVEEGREAASLLQRRGSRRELLGPLALPPAAPWYGGGPEELRASPRDMATTKPPDFDFPQQLPPRGVSPPTAIPLPASGFQPSEAYPALGDTPPPPAELLQLSAGSSSQSRPPPHPLSPGNSGAPRPSASPVNAPYSDGPAPLPLSLAALTRPEAVSQNGVVQEAPSITSDVNSLGPMAGRGGKPVYLPSPGKAPSPPVLLELQDPSLPQLNLGRPLVGGPLLPSPDLAMARPSPVSILQQPEPVVPVPSLVFDGFPSPLGHLSVGPPVAPLESVLSMDPHYGIPPSLAPPASGPLPSIPPIAENSLAEPVPLFRASPPQSPTSGVSSGISAAWTAALAVSDSPHTSTGEAADWAATRLAEDMAAAVLQSPLKAPPLGQPEVTAAHGSAVVGASKQMGTGVGERLPVSIAPLRILEPEWGTPHSGLKLLTESARGRGNSWGRTQSGAVAGADGEQQVGAEAAVVVPVSKGPGFVKIHPEEQKVLSPSLQERVIQEQRLPSRSSADKLPASLGTPSPAPSLASELPAAPPEQPSKEAAQAVQHAGAPEPQSPAAEEGGRAAGVLQQAGGAGSPAGVSLHSEQLRLVDDQIRFQSQSQLLSETPSAQPAEDAGAGAGPSAAQAEKEAKYAGLQEIFDGDLEEIRELGSGTFGTVHYGKWRGTDVAIKRLKASVFSGGEDEDKTDGNMHSGDISLSGDLPVEVKRRQNKEIADFWKEAELLSSLHHPNVVAFYGVVKDKGKPVATVTEYMVNGSLKQVLQKKDRTIDRKKRILIAMDASFGMEYLHTKHIVHFDLKCDNLLVNMRDPQRPVCKVGDLGLSKIKKKTMCSGGVRGTLPWMAPELLDGNSHFVTEKVDVFSFGIVLWELLTGEEPYRDMHHGAIIGGIVNNTLRPTIPAWCDPAWRALMERCWAQDQKARPSFKEISDQLRAMYAALSKPGRT